VETGTRANYGVEYSIYGAKNISSSFLFGQSYHFSGDEIIDKALGIDSKYSDYVGRLQTNFDLVSLAYRFRLDKDDFSDLMNEWIAE
jgi:LPS-assembly protein